MYHCHDSRLISSTTSSTIKALLVKREAFLAFHKTQTHAYHIKQIPCFTFLLFEHEIHIAKAVDRSGGVIKNKPSHLVISFQILAAPTQ
jgi:hypothetical protein